MIIEYRKPSLLVVDDVEDAVKVQREFLEEAGYEVFSATTVREAHEILSIRFVDLLMLDERLGRDSGTRLLEEVRRGDPGIAGILVTGHADVESAVRAMRAGMLDLLQKPIDRRTMLDAVARALGESELTRAARFRRWEALHRSGFGEIVGESPELQKVLSVVRQVIPTDVPVLIQGESGTGKELVARALHEQGRRRDRPFIAFNAAAIPATLMESTLFGAKRGAYTDAKADQRGLFEAADGGTLFLDEIGDTTPEVQVRLLRALQEKIIHRVGDVKPIPVDVRVVAATNRDLRNADSAHPFRSDLYFRLAVMPITMPPLRNRAGDIPILTRHLLEKHAREMGRSVKRFSSEALAKLSGYRWPGNVRELDNVIQRAVILADGEIIGPSAVILESEQAGSSFEDFSNLPFREAQHRFEERYFTELLRRTNDNKSKAAELAGLDRSSLHAHLRKLGSEPE
jgi:DNA-binding NtrC family response regulator